MKAAHRIGYVRTSLAFSEGNYPIPNLKKPDEIKVQVHAAAINPVDYKGPVLLFGRVYGLDYCGTIVEVGSHVQNLKVGDVVYGFGRGTLAEYVVAKACDAAKMPATGWTVQEAAALPTAYNTALSGWARVQLDYRDNPPESMLIIGASGGCGLAATQLAKGMMGVQRIVGICSRKNADLVKENGATEVVPYDDQEALDQFWKDNEGKFDHVYDAASFSGNGEDYTVVALGVLKETTGTFIALNASPSSWMGALMGGNGFRDKRQTLHMTKHSTEYLEAAVSLLDKAQLKPHVDLLPFTEESCKAGFDKLKSRRTKGKIVFDIAPLDG